MNLPNLLTAIRILLTPWIVFRFAAGDCRGALVLLFIAGASDAADGFIARRWKQITRLGSYLDPIADKLLLTAVFLSLGVAGAVPAWLVWLVVGRDVVILLMAAAAMAFTTYRDYPPSIWGKLSTAAQIATALFGALTCAAPVPAALIWVTGAITAWSGVHYVARAIRVALTRPPAVQ